MRTRWLSARSTLVPQRDRAAESTAVKTESHGDPMHIPSDRILRPPSTFHRPNPERTSPGASPVKLMCSQPGDER